MVLCVLLDEVNNTFSVRQAGGVVLSSSSPQLPRHRPTGFVVLGQSVELVRADPHQSHKSLRADKSGHEVIGGAAFLTISLYLATAALCRWPVAHTSADDEHVLLVCNSRSATNNSGV